MREYIIGPNDAGQRMDKYLFKLLKNAGSGLIFKQLRNKNIVLNGKKAAGNEILKENDSIKVFMADDTIDKFTRSDNNPRAGVLANTAGKLNIIYENSHIILADKPAGILSQKAKPSDVSMNEYLNDYYDSKYIKSQSTFRPAFCNRLDRNTSGLMVGGMSLKGLQKMSEIIKNRSLQKYYLAIALGKLEGKDGLKGYLYKDENTNKVMIKDREFPGASPIHTEYESIAYHNGLTLLKIHLITGKTHQIRAHMAYMGHPLLGDGKYGNRDANIKYNARIQMLHSHEVIFPEMEEDFSDISGKCFKTDFPENFSLYFPDSSNLL